MGVVEDSINALMCDHIKMHGVDVTGAGIDLKDIPSTRVFRIGKKEIFLGTWEREACSMEGLAMAQALHATLPGGGTFLIVYPAGLHAAIRAGGSIDDETRAGLEPILRSQPFTVFFKPRAATPPERVVMRYDELPGYFLRKMETREHHPIDVETMIDELEKLETRLRDLLHPGNKETAKLFSSILGISVDGDKCMSGAAAAATDAVAYLLISRFILYDMLFHINPARYPSMDPSRIGKKVDIETILGIVSQGDFAPLFAHDIMACLPEARLAAIKAMIGAVLFLSPGAIKKELMGRLFHKLIPLAIRREVAAFYTTTASAELLAHLAIDHANQRVIDPACGSGALLLASYQRLRSLRERALERIDQEPPGSCRIRLIGTDIMPFSAHLATINLAIQQVETGEPPSFHVASLDATRLEKRMAIDGLQGGSIPIEGIGLVIMNPPFTRQELINNLPGEKEHSTLIDEYKDRAISNILAGTRTRYSGLLNKKQAFSSYFVVIADKLLDDGGCIAAVLPATILRTEYNHHLRAFLLANYSLRYIVSRNDALNFSDDTTLKEVLLVARKQPPSADHAVCYVTVDGLVDGLALSIMARERDLPADGKFHEYQGFNILKKPQHDLDASNLFGPISLGSVMLQDTWSRVESSTFLRPLRAFARAIPRSGRQVITREGAASRAFAKLPQMAIVAEPETRTPFTFSRIEDGKIHFQGKQRMHFIDKHETFAYVRHARHPTLSLDLLDEFVIWAISSNDLFEEIDGCNIASIRRAIEAIETARQPITRGKTYTIEEIRAGFREFHDALAGMNGKTIASIFNKVASGHGFASFQDAWRNYLADKLCYLGTVDALHVEAPNTCFFAYFAGETPRVFSSIFLNVPCLSKQQARINALWLNSALNMIQLFRERNPTGWFKIKQYILEGLKIIDVDAIDADSLKNLEATFNDISQEDFPCLWQQFFTCIPGDMIDGKLRRGIMNAFGLDEATWASLRARTCNGRLVLDRAITRLFFPSKPSKEIDAFLHAIYRDLLVEIIIEKNNITRCKPDPSEGEADGDGNMGAGDSELGEGA